MFICKVSSEVHSLSLRMQVQETLGFAVPEVMAKEKAHAELEREGYVDLLLDDELDRGDSLQRIARLARPEASLIAKSVATLGITSSVTLLIPSVCGHVIDMCINDPSGISPYYAAGGLLGLTAIAGGGVVLRSRWLSVAGNRIVARMRRQLFDATLAQDVAFFDRVPTGDLVTRLAADTQMIQRAATVQVVSAMRSLIMGLGGTGCLLYTSPPLAMVSLGTLPPIFLAARYFGRVIKDRQKHVQELLSQSTTVAEETFSNVRTVRQFAAERHESSRYGSKVEQTYEEAVSVFFVVGDLCSTVERRKQKHFAVKRRKQNPKCTGCMFSKTTFLNRIPVLKNVL